jgi:hypothetical protein
MKKELKKDLRILAKHIFFPLSALPRGINRGRAGREKNKMNEMADGQSKVCL